MHDIRIALLITEDSEEFGGAEGVLAYYAQRFKVVCPQMKLIPFTVCQDSFPFDVDDFPMYVITGSRHNVSPNIKWQNRLQDFIREIQRKPYIRMVGICFGHQITAAAFGGEVGPNPLGEFIWECGKVEVTEELSAKQCYKDSNLDKSGFYVMQSHGEQVIRKPDTAKELGSCPDCRYEVLLYGNNILTFQGHPEAETQKMLSNIPILEREKIMTKEQIERSMKSFHNDEANKTTKLILNFLTTS